MKATVTRSKPAITIAVAQKKELPAQLIPRLLAPTQTDTNIDFLTQYILQRG
jgi:hypothetical protein